MIKNLALWLPILLSFCNFSQSSYCPQLCKTCIINTCISCYQDWFVNATTTFTIPCQCPVGYYMNTTMDICNFCPSDCVTCTNYTTCTQCLYAYSLINGTCTPPLTYPIIKIKTDLANNDFNQNIIQGFTFTGTKNFTLFSQLFDSCILMFHQPMLGKNIFSYNTVVSKKYYSLPEHGWVLLKFQYFIIGPWAGESLIIEIERGKSENSSTSSFILTKKIPYNENLRTVAFCSSYKDSLGIFNQTVQHVGSTLKFTIYTSIKSLQSSEVSSSQSKISFGIREVLLISGLCPQNCQTCSSLKYCIKCSPFYTLSNNICKCNLQVAILTANGICIEKCLNGIQVFEQQICQTCGKVFKWCVLCSQRSIAQKQNETKRFKCIQCEKGKFIHEGDCVDQCPEGFYENFTNYQYSCSKCPQGCNTCQNNLALTDQPQICLSCLQKYIFYFGQCFEKCPTKTYANPKLTECLPCPNGCQQCTSVTNCSACIQTSNSSQIIYKIQDFRCVLVCIQSPTLVYNSKYKCPQTLCHQNCSTCIGNLSTQCYKCKSPFYTENYKCVMVCSNGFYLQSLTTKRCLPCQNNCLQCNAYQCYECAVGYWLMNTQCVRLCPEFYYHSTFNGKYLCSECKNKNCQKCTEILDQTSPINSHSFCLSCVKSYFLSNNTCQQYQIKCQDATYYNTLKQTCIQCFQGCLQCYDSLCFKCNTNLGLILDKGKCVRQCSQGKIEIFGKCVRGNSLCETFEGNKCSKCIETYPSLIFQNQTQLQCQFSCPIGKSKQSITSKLCTINCPQNCLNCIPLTSSFQAKCIQCSPSYLIHEGSCIQNCPERFISNAIQCLSCVGNCLKCQDDGQCLICENGLLNKNGICQSEGCNGSQLLNDQLSGKGTCALCANICKSCTNISTKCTSCNNKNHYLTPTSTCSSSCPSSYFKNSLTMTCSPCPPTCQTCTTFLKCTSCFPNFFIYKLTSTTIQCISQCPTSTYISPSIATLSLTTIPLTCTKCKPTCLTCIGGQSYNCLNCITGYKFFRGTCIKKCLDGFYDSNGYCEQCHQTCKECSGPADFECKKCYEETQDPNNGNNLNYEMNKVIGYFYSGRCYSGECPIQTFWNSGAKKCSKCPANCNKCQSSTICLNCSQNYFIFNGKCRLSCPTNTFLSPLIFQCQLCSESFQDCLQCTFRYCTRCSQPYYLISVSTHSQTSFTHQCVLSCPSGTFSIQKIPYQCAPCPRKCLTCTSLTNCSNCSPYFQQTNGQCEDRCIDGYVYQNQQCVSCGIPNCQGCYIQLISDKAVCAYCQINHKLINNQCLPITPCPISTYKYLQTCLNCHPSCLSCISSTSCLSCIQNFTLTNALCIQLDNVSGCSFLENCIFCASSNLCLLCSNGTVLNTQKGICVQSCPLGFYKGKRECLGCREGCLKCENDPTLCYSCKKGYYLLDYQCRKQCPTQYASVISPVLQSQVCQLCSQTLQFCQSCLSSTHCLVCQSSYYLSSSFKCQIKPICQRGYYYLQQLQTCTSCNQNCQICADGSTCIICENGYLQDDGECGKQCEDGKYGMVKQFFAKVLEINSEISNLILTGQICIICQFPCLTCTKGKCLSCHPTFLLSNSTCVPKCPQSYYPKYEFESQAQCFKCPLLCFSCISQQICTSCIQNKFLQNSKCVDQCENGMYGSARVCVSCTNFCLICSSNGTCLQCISGMWIIQGKCLQRCPLGYIPTISPMLYTLTCQQCPQPCFSCQFSFDEVSCLTCISNYFLHNKLCLTTCPLGYFSDAYSSKCLKCPSWCLECTDYFSCQKCLNNCEGNCQKYENGCFKCEDQCRICEGGIEREEGKGMGTCLQCYHPYLLANKTCKLDCPVGQYAAKSGKCEVCNCSSCTPKGQCLSCPSQYVLYQGICIESCPQDTFLSSTMNCQPSLCFFPSSPIGCLSCYSPHVFYNQSCINSCPSSTFLAQSSPQCLPCTNNCQKCVSYSNCLTCKSGTYRIQLLGTISCEVNCGVSFYGIDGQCRECRLGCRECEINGCIVCLQGYHLVTKNNVGSEGNTAQCVQTCPIGYFPSSFFSLSISKCQPCPTNCLSCLPPLISLYPKCTSCFPSFYFHPQIFLCSSQCLSKYYPHSNTCLPCQNLCSICTNSSYCLSCQNGYVWSSGQCLQECGSNMYKFYDEEKQMVSCGFCSQFSCRTCTYNPQKNPKVQCLSCFSHLILLPPICTSHCIQNYYQISSVCQPCSPPCLTCKSSMQCLSCIHTHTLSSSNTCISNCSSLQYYDTNTNACSNCSSICGSFGCSGPRFDECYQCHGEQCFECYSGCIQCVGIYQNNCTRCLLGLYYLPVQQSTGQCVSKCPQTHYQNITHCLPCSQLQPYCNSCLINSSSLTLSCVQCSPFSTKIRTSSGLSCESPSFICPLYTMFINTNGQCEQCKYPCIQCIQNNSGENQQSLIFCFKCVLGYLLQNGNCVEECENGSVPIYQSQFSYLNITVTAITICKKCPSFCLICQAKTVPTCQSCIHPYILFQNTCLSQCPDSQILSFNPLTFQNQCKTTINLILQYKSFGLFSIVSSARVIPQVQCPNGYYSQIDKGTCEKCIEGCRVCVSQNTCQECHSPLYLINSSECKESCPTGYATISGNCYRCISPCGTCWSSLVKCESCLSNYFFLPQTKQCVSQCPPKYYSTGNNSICLPCSHQCLSCSISSSCSSCKNIFYSSPLCIDTLSRCPTNQYLSSPTQCAPCNSACNTCFSSSSTSCLSCSNGFLFRGECLNLCLSGMYPIIQVETSICELCSTAIAHCLVCNSTPTCQQCSLPFYLTVSSGFSSCVQSCDILSTNDNLYSSPIGQYVCIKCTTNCGICRGGKCVQCRHGLKLISQGVEQNCIEVCPIKYYEHNNKLCLKCGQDCLICQNSTTCTQCLPSYYLFNNKCIQQCPISTHPTEYQTCKNCNQIQNCLFCTSQISSKCTVCRPPYLLINTTCGFCLPSQYYQGISCQPCQQKCLTCHNHQKCDVCWEGLFIDFEGKCVENCPNGTAANGLKCQKCLETGCQICITISSCSKCMTPLFLDNQICTGQCDRGKYWTTIKLSESQDINVCLPCGHNCIQCNNSNNCQQCVSGYTQNQNGQCELERFCPSGTYVQSISPLLCLSCHPSCLECSSNTSTSCTSCSSSSQLNSSECIPRCSLNQYYSIEQSICINCSNNCRSCLNQSTFCLTCKTSLFLTLNASCTEICPITTYPYVDAIMGGLCLKCGQLCNFCQSIHKCFSCIEPHVLYNNKCLQFCPNGTYQIVNQSILICLACPVQCSICQAAETCLSCSLNYYLFAFECLQSCPENFYPDPQQKCLPCSQSCLICSYNDLNEEGSVCSLCYNEFILVDGKCYVECPAKYYQSGQIDSKQCSPCSEGCDICTNFTYCSECNDHYFEIVYQFELGIGCVDKCPQGYQLIIPFNHQCLPLPCLNICQLCFPNKTCLSCPNGTFILQSECVQNCPISYFASNSSLKCMRCFLNCQTCYYEDECQKCFDGYNLQINEFGSVCIGIEDKTTEDNENLLTGLTSLASNITSISSLVFLASSAGPAALGEVISTYFNLQFCQFIFFHHIILDENEEPSKFLKSLSSMSMSSMEQNQKSRRLLAQNKSLLEINVSIFMIIGFCIAVFCLTRLISKISTTCSNLSKIQMIILQVCFYLQKRFKWIYFDMVLWISYIPFLYYSLKQVQNFNFSSPLHSISSIISLFILVFYPLYPLLIVNKIKNNYQSLCQKNSQTVEMSLSPWVQHVIRPEHNQNQTIEFEYFSIGSLRLYFNGFKYLRKFIFVLVIVLCPYSIVTLSIILALNAIFLIYILALRPKPFPHIILDLAIEIIMIIFEALMLAAFVMSQNHTRTLSALLVGFGFVSANLSMFVGVMFNFVAYYKILMCIYDLVEHLKSKQSITGQNIQKEGSRLNIVDFDMRQQFDRKETKNGYKFNSSLTEEQINVQELDKNSTHLQQQITVNQFYSNQNILQNHQHQIKGQTFQSHNNLRIDDTQIITSNRKEIQYAKQTPKIINNHHSQNAQHQKINPIATTKKVKSDGKFKIVDNGINGNDNKNQQLWVEMGHLHLKQEKFGSKKLKSYGRKNKNLSANTNLQIEEKIERTQDQKESLTNEMLKIDDIKKSLRKVNEQKQKNFNFKRSERSIGSDNSSPEKLLNKKENQKEETFSEDRPFQSQCEKNIDKNDKEVHSVLNIIKIHQKKEKESEETNQRSLLAGKGKRKEKAQKELVKDIKKQQLNQLKKIDFGESQEDNQVTHNFNKNYSTKVQDQQILKTTSNDNSESKSFHHKLSLTQLEHSQSGSFSNNSSMNDLKVTKMNSSRPKYTLNSTDINEDEQQKEFDSYDKYELVEIKKITDTSQPPKIRPENKQKLRSKASLQIKQKLSLFSNDEIQDDIILENKNEPAKRKGNAGILKIQHFDQEGQEDLDNVQL